MCTKAWRARKCRQGQHVWSWTVRQDLNHRTVEHACRFCGTWSEPVRDTDRVLWRCRNGLLSLELFFPEVVRAQRIATASNFSRWLGMVGAALVCVFTPTVLYCVGGILIASALYVLHKAAAYELAAILVCAEKGGSTK